MKPHSVLDQRFMHFQARHYMAGLGVVADSCPWIYTELNLVAQSTILSYTAAYLSVYIYRPKKPHTVWTGRKLSVWRATSPVSDV
jgi:hypothetical protein